MNIEKAFTAKDVKENKAQSIFRAMTQLEFAFSATLALIVFASLASFSVQSLDLG